MAIQRILVADDEESMRWVLSKALRKKGFAVDLVGDGDEVDVIGHETVAENAEAGWDGALCEKVKVSRAVLVGEEDVLAVVSALGDVMR